MGWLHKNKPLLNITISYMHALLKGYLELNNFHRNLKGNLVKNSISLLKNRSNFSLSYTHAMLKSYLELNNFHRNLKGNLVKNSISLLKNRSNFSFTCKFNFMNSFNAKRKHSQHVLFKSIMENRKSQYGIYIQKNELISNIFMHSHLYYFKKSSILRLFTEMGVSKTSKEAIIYKHIMAHWRRACKRNNIKNVYFNKLYKKYSEYICLPFIKFLIKHCNGKFKYRLKNFVTRIFLRATVNDWKGKLCKVFIRLTSLDLVYFQHKSQIHFAKYKR